ncbi:MAG: hypothetical protein H6581_20150 [Bacteroidia bacterium]|nr:hypothetical protein [Bacteroidia bacterium]
MKKIYSLICCLCLVGAVNAADLSVDKTGAVAGSYPSITAALAAAVDGDRLVIYTEGGNYFENPTVDASVTLMAASPRDYWGLEGNLLIQPANGREVSIIGMTIWGTANGAGNTPVGARCVVNFVDCRFSEISNFSFDGFEVNVLYCYSNKAFNIRRGSFIGNDFEGTNSGIGILPGNAAFGTGDTVLIIANSFQTINRSSHMTFNNPNVRFYVANNFWNNRNASSGFQVVIADTAGKPNVFRNNTYWGYNSNSNSNCNATSTHSILLRGVKDHNASSNIFASDYGTGGGCVLYGMKGGEYNLFYGLSYTPGLLRATNSYGGSSSSIFDPSTGAGIGAFGQNTGNPNTEFLDLDLTRNDRGTYGGPFSWENYRPNPPSDGRARVWFLEMPSKIYDLGGTTVVKAKGVHLR